MTDTFTVTLAVPNESKPAHIGRAIILTPSGKVEHRILLPSKSDLPRSEANLRLYAVKLIREMYETRAIQGEYMPYHFNDRATGSHVAVVCVETDRQHTFRPYEPIQYALDDCWYWDKNKNGDCGGRVELVNGSPVCENCRNR